MAEEKAQAVAGRAPKVADLVHYYDGDFAHAAIVTRVHDKATVNIRVFHENGTTSHVTSCPRATKPGTYESGHWSWPAA